MTDVNSWVGAGRLTRDAELRHTAGGFAIVTFALASTERTKKGENWEDYSNFFDCKILGKFGESMHKHLTKGRQVMMSARLHQDRWEKDGQKQSKLVLIVESLQFAGSEGKGKGEPPKEIQAPQGEEVYPDDVPF